MKKQVYNPYLPIFEDAAATASDSVRAYSLEIVN